MWVAAMKPRPTMPTLIMAGTLESGDGLLDEAAGGSYVLEALAAGLAFDAAVAGESQGIERAEEFRPIDFTGADRDFVAPSAARAGASGVLDMDLLEPGTENAQRFDGIAFVVKNDVGGIKIDADVWRLQFFQEFEQGGGAFLAGFESKVDSPGGEDIGDEAEAMLQFGEFGIAFVVREETGVKGDEPEVQLARELRDDLEVLPVPFPGPVGRQPAGQANSLHRGVILAHRGEHAGDDLDSVLRGQVGEVAPEAGLSTDRVEGNLRAWNAERLELFDEGLRSRRLEGPTANRQTLAQRFWVHRIDSYGLRSLICFTRSTKPMKPSAWTMRLSRTSGARSRPAVLIRCFIGGRET